MNFTQIGADHRLSILRRGLLLCLLFLLPSTALSQQSSSPPPGSDNSDFNGLSGNFNPSMGVIVIVLIAALFFMGFFSIYIRHCSDDDSSSVPRRAPAQTGRSRRAQRGLDPSVLETFPVFDYADVKSLKIGKGALECAVCLNEFEDDETLRLIPKCDHVFHPDCIDAWLAAHTTCPVCRADLVPLPGESVHAPELGHIQDGDLIERNDAVSIDMSIPVGQVIETQTPAESESMDQPLNARPRLNRNRTSRNLSGRPKWFGKFSRSNSTGHVAVKQWENMERFTLRLPEDVRRQIMSGKLNRTTSCVANRGWARPGEGSSRGRSLNSGRFDRAGRSDRWVFSLAPPFFSRSVRVTGGSVRSTKSAADSVHAADTVAEPKLPPV